MSFHFKEISWRLFYFFFSFLFTFCFIFFYSQELFFLMSFSLIKFNQGFFIFTNLSDAFFAFLKFSFFLTFFISMPFFFIQFYFFLKPGIYINIFYLCLYILHYIIGFFIAIELFIPITYEFFLGFKLDLPLSPLSLNLFTKIDQFISFFFSTLFSFLLLFQLLFFFVFLSINNFISYKFLINSRKYNFIFSLIFFSLLSPPDIFSLFIFTLPFLFFYEFLIIFLLIYKEIKNK